MTDIALPTFARGIVQVHRQICVGPAQAYESPFDGSLQTGASMGPRWECSLSIRPMTEDDAVELEAWIMKLRGQANRALLPYFKRQTPRGTISTSGVTLDGALAAGATQCSLAGCGNAGTLKTGDMMKIGDQMVMAVDGPYTADASGNMANVVFEYPLRAAALTGASVTLNAPTLRYVLKQPEAGWESRAPVITEFFGMDFREAFD
jgi:hypothetical protein